MITTNSKTLYSMLVKELQEVLIQSLNNNFKNIEMRVSFSEELEFIPIYFDYSKKKILVGGSETITIPWKSDLYYQSIFRIDTFLLGKDKSKEEIVQELKKSILKDEVFLDYFEEKNHDLKLDFLYDELINQTKLSPLLKLLIEVLPHDEKNAIMFWNSFDVKNRTEYLFSKNSTKNKVVNYIREVCWEKLLNNQKESLNRCLYNSYCITTSYVNIYKNLLYLTYFSETVKETELYKEVLELFKQSVFKNLILKTGEEKTTVFCDEEDLEEFLSYIKHSGSIGFEEFWQLLSETVGEKLELEITETVPENC